MKYSKAKIKNARYCIANQMVDVEAEDMQEKGRIILAELEDTEKQLAYWKNFAGEMQSALLKTYNAGKRLRGAFDEIQVRIDGAGSMRTMADVWRTKLIEWDALMSSKH